MHLMQSKLPDEEYRVWSSWAIPCRDDRGPKKTWRKHESFNQVNDQCRLCPPIPFFLLPVPARDRYLKPCPSHIVITIHPSILLPDELSPSSLAICAQVCFWHAWRGNVVTRLFPIKVAMEFSMPIVVTLRLFFFLFCLLICLFSFFFKVLFDKVPLPMMPTMIDTNQH